jgi:uncharacterized membrane protein YtjA (UPF0391 family)
MHYCADAFICVAIAAGLYGQSEVPTGPAFIGKLVFSVFLTHAGTRRSSELRLIVDIRCVVPVEIYRVRFATSIPSRTP